MNLASAALALLAATPSLADDRLARAEALLGQELAQMRASLPCVALDPVFAQIGAGWTEVVDDAVATLRGLRGTETLIATLAPAADPEALLPPPDTPFAELRAHCQSDLSWQTHLGTFAYWGLGQRLERLLTE